MSGGPSGTPAEQVYFEEVEPAVLAALRVALAEDPLADVVVFASREGDVSYVSAVPRKAAILHLASSPVPSLARIATEIARSPSHPLARWVVLVAPGVVAAGSVILVDHRTEARA